MTKWKFFDINFEGLNLSDNTNQQLVDFLNSIEEQGYEPRKFDTWHRNSYTNPWGCTIYARKKD
jgi:ABC-type transporter MlaC component